VNITIIFAVVLLLLFGLAFATKRRFGVLGLALTAGAMLSNLWAAKLTPIFAQAGVVVEHPPLQTIVAIGLVLLPAVLLLFSGPSYREMPLRVAGALCFAVLATAFLVEPIGNSMVLTGQSRDVYNFIVTNRVYLVTAGLTIALVDVLATRQHRHYKKHDK